MNTKSILFSGLLLAITSILSGCGSSTASFSTTNDGSTGAQLKDLSDAHKQGIIDDKEFSKLKKAIIKNND